MTAPRRSKWACAVLAIAVLHGCGRGPAGHVEGDVPAVQVSGIPNRLELLSEELELLAAERHETMDDLTRARFMLVQRRINGLRGELLEQLELAGSQSRPMVDGASQEVAAAGSAPGNGGDDGLAWWWGLVGVGLILAVGWSTSGGADPTGSTAPPGQDQQPTVSPTRPAPATPSSGPEAVRHEFEHPDPLSAASAAARWLSEDPRVLLSPGPEVGPVADRVHVAYYLAPDLPAGEGYRMEVELATLLGGQVSGGSQGRSGSNVVTGQAFKHGKAEASGYTPRPRAARLHQNRP